MKFVAKAILIPSGKEIRTIDIEPNDKGLMLLAKIEDEMYKDKADELQASVMDMDTSDREPNVWFDVYSIKGMFDYDDQTIYYKRGNLWAIYKAITPERYGYSPASNGEYVKGFPLRSTKKLPSSFKNEIHFDKDFADLIGALKSVE